MEIATAGSRKMMGTIAVIIQDSVLEETWSTVYIGAPMLKERAL